MKKLYTMLAALAITASAAAQDGAPLYLTGDFTVANGQTVATWTPTAPAEFVYADGVYTVTIEEASQFKMSPIKGDWSTFNGGSLNCPKLLPGVQQELTKGDKNILLGWKGTWTITVSGDLKTIVANTDTPNPNEGQFTTLYIKGELNNWSNDTPLFTEDGKIYTREGVTIAAGGAFKIADENWGEYNFGDVADMVINTPYVLSNGSNTGNCTAAMDFNNVTFRFNLETYELTVLGEGDIPKIAKKLYIVGENYGNWSRDNAYQMTMTSDIDDPVKVYTIDMANLKGEWKIFDGTWAYSWGAGFDDVVLGQPIESFFNSSENFSSDFNEAVTVTLTIPEGADVDGSELAATIMINLYDRPALEPLPAPEALYIVGQVNNGLWGVSADRVVTMTKEGNTFVASNVEVNDGGSGFGYFSFISKLGTTADDWETVNTATRYGAEYDGDYIDDQVEGYFYAYANGEAPAWMCVAGVYDIKIDFDTRMVTLTQGAGVGSIIFGDEAMPVEYFNLQGQRVVNPTNGLYIVRQGSKVTKVIVRN